MKLSEAIMLGSVMFKQNFGGSGAGEWRCALAGAAVAVGASYYIGLINEWPWIYFSIPRTCPECATEKPIAAQVVTHLNDCHAWSCEKIAEWVASIEPQPEPQAMEGRAPSEPNQMECFVEKKG